MHDTSRAGAHDPPALSGPTATGDKVLANFRARIGNSWPHRALALVGAGMRHNPCYVRLVAIGAMGMTTDVTRAEFDQLKARLDVVEREVNGEKTITRHIVEQTRHNGDDLATVKSRLDRHDQRFDSLERRFDGLERQVAALREDIPSIVGDVMRDVLRERDKKP